MGDGKQLRQILNSQGKTVKQLSKATGLRTTTLYSIIQKDSNIKFDYAIRIANELKIDVNEICSESPLSGDLTENELNKMITTDVDNLEKTRIKNYVLNTAYPLFTKFGTDDMPDVDKILKGFYQLDRAGRGAIIEILDTMLRIHEEPQRKQEVNGIKGW